MSAGTGVMHSEVNQSKEPVHLLQIWILPEAEGLKPSYEDLTIPTEEKHNHLRLIASHDGRDNSTTIHQDASVYASLLDHGKSLELELKPGRHAWVQLISGRARGQWYEAGTGRRRRDQRRNLAPDSQHGRQRCCSNSLPSILPDACCGCGGMRRTCRLAAPPFNILVVPERKNSN